MKQNARYDEVKHTVRVFEAIFEIGVLCLIYYIFWRDYYRWYQEAPFYGAGRLIVVSVYAVMLICSLYLCDGYKFGHLKIADILITQWVCIALVNFLTYFQNLMMMSRLLPVWVMFAVTGIQYLISTVLVFVFTWSYHHNHAPRDLIMIYGNDNAIDLKFKMETRPDKYAINRVISCDADWQLIRTEISEHEAVIINDVPAIQRNDILKYCFENKIRAYVVPKVTDIILRGAEDISLFDTPLLMVKSTGLNRAEKIIKRVMDLVLCGIAMIPALPIMLLIALAIKLEDHGPVFYKQTRVTMNQKRFDILKFRSMIVDAEKNGEVIPATGRDPRITRVGRFIRACRVDELPQLINILKGDMSIVGPRPERVEHVEKYMADIPEFAYRYKVQGGLTGYAQIFGKYNTSAYDKLRMDIMYIENYSILMDVKLIIMTLRILFKKESTEGFDTITEMDKKKETYLKEQLELSERRTLELVGKKQ